MTDNFFHSLLFVFVVLCFVFANQSKDVAMNEWALSAHLATINVLMI